MAIDPVTAERDRGQHCMITARTTLCFVIARMTAPRIIVAGATTAATRRTTLRKAFLAPWHPGVGQAWLYSLAHAALRTGVAVHHATRVLTHHHLTVTPDRDNLPEFLRLFHHDSSCALNTLLARERYDQPGELFDDRSTHLMRLLDAPAQSATLLYEYLNTVAAGLVDRPEHMPGYCFDFELWQRGVIEVKRPDFYFSSDRPELLRLPVTPPPLLLAAFDGDLDKLVYSMQRLASDGARELRAARSRDSLGARALVRMHPWSEPRTLRETRGKLVPSFRLGARGIVGRQVRIEAALETRAFREQYRCARNARRAGDLRARFPYGTYQLRLQHSVPVAPAPIAGLINKPGPLLGDVLAELGSAKRHRVDRAEGRFALVDEVRDAFREEAVDICEQASATMDFAAEQGRGAAADVIVVRHRFARGRVDGDARTRRVVTLRDRRLGRPRATRQGADPPD
jgi:hypothetical protein